MLRRENRVSRVLGVMASGHVEWFMNREGYAIKALVRGTHPAVMASVPGVLLGTSVGRLIDGELMGSAVHRPHNLSARRGGCSRITSDIKDVMDSLDVLVCRGPIRQPCCQGIADLLVGGLGHALREYLCPGPEFAVDCCLGGVVDVVRVQSQLLDDLLLGQNPDSRVERLQSLDHLGRPEWRVEDGTGIERWSHVGSRCLTPALAGKPRDGCLFLLVEQGL